MFASSSDWLIVQFVAVVISQSNYVGFGSTALKGKPLCEVITLNTIILLIITLQLLNTCNLIYSTGNGYQTFLE